MAGEVELKGKWYVDGRINMLLNRTQNNVLYSQQFLDFELSKYLFRNDNVRMSLMLRNIFDIKDKILVSQSDNYQSIQYTNVVPRIMMFHVTVFPERWSSK